MSTSRYVIDAWAWIEYLKGTATGLFVKKEIEGKEILTNVVTLSEVMSKFQRDGQDVDEGFQAIASLSKMVAVNEQFAKEVGVLHAETKRTRPNFSLADAYALCTARKFRAKVLTGDLDFKGLKDAVIIKKLIE